MESVRRSAASGVVGYSRLPVLVSGTFSYRCLATIGSLLLEHPCTTVPHVNALVRGTTKFLAMMENVQTDGSEIWGGLDLDWSMKITALKKGEFCNIINTNLSLRGSETVKNPSRGGELRGEA